MKSCKLHVRRTIRKERRTIRKERRMIRKERRTICKERLTFMAGESTKFLKERHVSSQCWTSSFYQFQRLRPSFK